MISNHDIYHLKDDNICNAYKILNSDDKKGILSTIKILFLIEATIHKFRR